MTNYTDYTKYFKNLSVKFIGHSESEKHFFSTGLEEFLNGLQTTVNYPAILLDSYDYIYEHNGADSYTKNRTIAFIVCDNAADIEDYERIAEIRDTCENIIDEIYKQIRKDIAAPYTQNFLRYAQLSNVEVVPVFNHSDQNYGYHVTFELKSIVL